MEYERNALFSESLSLLTLWKKDLWLIILALLFGYIVSTIVVFHPEGDTYSSTTNVYSYTLYGAKMSAMADLVRTDIVTEKAEILINDPSITKGVIYNMLSVDYSPSSLVMNISATSGDADKVLRVSNTVAKVFVNEINNQIGENAVELLQETDRISVSEKGIVTVILKRVIISVAFILFAMFLIALKRILKKEIQVASDFSCNNELEVIGLIPRHRRVKK